MRTDERHHARKARQQNKLKVQILRVLGIGVLSATMLTACGGGGSYSPAPPAPPVVAGGSFALSAGYRARIVSGATDNFNLSGNCSGTATISTAAAAADTFEGVPGYSSAQVSTVNFTNCAPPTNSVTGTTYYNARYVLIGQSIMGGDYAKFVSPPADLPATVKVGDTAVIATLTTYADSTKAVVNGKRELSYVIEADTSTTAIANLITKSYDVGNNLLATQQSRYRMAENGALTLLSIDVQFSFNSNIHLVYTPR